MKINKIELKAKRAKRFYGWHLLPPSFLPATTYSRKGGAAGGGGVAGVKMGGGNVVWLTVGVKSVLILAA